MNIELYHATSKYNCKNILENGKIIPQGSNGVGYIALPSQFDEILDKFMGYIFLASDFQTAKEYGESMDNEGYIIMELSISDDQLLPDDIDSPQSKTWIESSNDIKQVKVKGEINIDRINNIYLINNDVITNIYSKILKDD